MTAGNPFEQLTPGDSNKVHKFSDVDTSWKAQHHTLGSRPNQAAPGNHTHNGINSPSLGSSFPVGGILAWPAADAPEGFLLCEGGIVSRETYADLFAVIGVTYGAGDGSTTFTLPDLRVRTIVGRGTGKAIGTTEGLVEASRNSTFDHSHSHSASGGTSFDSHSHTGAASIESHNHGASFSGTTGSDGTHSHGAGSLATFTAGGHSHSGNTGGPGITTDRASGAFSAAHQNHSHSFTTSSDPGHNHGIGGGTDSQGSHSHSMSDTVSVISDDHDHIVSVGLTGHSHSVSASVFTGAAATHAYMALNWIIKV